MDRTDISDNLPPNFVIQVRDALVHLYDYAHLERHPLVATLSADEIALGAGRALRNRVLDAVEELHPDDSVARGTRGWRPYDILTQRYVDGFVVDDILESLHISLRQFQREQRRALLAVASILWRRQAVPLTESDQAQQAGNQLAVEVERLGLRLEAVEVGMLVEDALRPVRPFALHRQAEITMVESPALVALVDRALVRQALVAALGAPVSSGPCTMRVSWRLEQDEVVILIEADLVPDGRQQAQGRIEGIANLLSGQGGRAVLEDDPSIPWRLSLYLRCATGSPVLVVDDDRRLRQLFSRYLESEGFRFRGVAGAREALRYLEASKPEVIIMDVMMRDMDGWQLLQILRSRQELSQTPIIVCSVLDEPGLADALGAQLYLRKPIGPQELLSAVRQVLGQTSPTG